ncbi:hypothetical protein ACLI1A_11695 [Flavobacterium sp. RHBU_3]|uniref:hypothetical protein n=1 Tax=Flavobacterium sp. RHBU_3 TaxID=3391184 RepID=UPI0039851B58
MKDKALFYIVVMMFIVVTLGARMYFLGREIDDLKEKQYEDLNHLKTKNLNKIDSIEVLKTKKETLIEKKQKKLYDDIAKAKRNDEHYEQIKKDIGNTDDADSLARKLTERY